MIVEIKLIVVMERMQEILSIINQREEQGGF
jgi:hypothetical protein